MPTIKVTIDGGPMSIFHWGMHDLGRFGVYYLNGLAHWQEDRETFDIRSHQQTVI
ncbi:hypothetical protein [Rhizobium azibense]|uniref:hypothetical protein n=1 Tax=Rhizobium azibense TaxID=1136135 RepID=UPI0014042C18|nr:hypothetical protein [Rhizobium azibense]